MSCSDGKFIFAVVECEDPGTPIYGTRRGDIFTYKSKTEFTCDVGYRLQGAPNITCQANGNWSDKTPDCQRKFIIMALNTSLSRKI